MSPYDRIFARKITSSPILPDVDYLVYSVRRDKVGILRNYIVQYAGGVGADTGDLDLIVIASAEEYMQYQLEWAMRHTIGFSGFQTIKQYAKANNIREYAVRKFARTALAYVLGVRGMIGVDGKEYITMPANLPTRVWVELRSKKKRMSEIVRRKYIVSFLQESGEILTRDLIDRMMGYSRDSCRKTIAGMADDGVVLLKGSGVKSRISLPKGEL